MEFPDLHVFFLTVGEKVSLESLNALRENTKQPHKLTIWYDACGRGVDWTFYEKLRDYTDDVILLTKNHGCVGAVAYAMLYLDFKYLMIVLADTVVRPGYLDRLAFGFTRIDKSACVGSTRTNHIPWDFLVNERCYMPDGVQIYKKEAINDVGGVAAAFKGTGQETLEWQERAIRKGWNIVSCKDIMDEIGSTHDGRPLNPDLNEQIEKSQDTYLRIKNAGWKDFHWWDTTWATEQPNPKGEIVHA